MSKQSSKPLLVFGLMLFICSALIVLSYVGIKVRCEELVKEKVLEEEKLNLKRNEKIALIAEHQNYNSEERITFLAEELGMIKQVEAPVKLKVDKEKIEKLENIISEKYD